MFFGEPSKRVLFRQFAWSVQWLFLGVFRLVVGGGVVVYLLCGFWLGGGGGFAFLEPFLLLVGGSSGSRLFGC